MTLSFASFQNKDVFEMFLQKMTYKDIIVILITFGIFFIFYFDYSIWQKFSHAKYLVIFISGIAFMGYVNSRLVVADSLEKVKYIVNSDFDSVLSAIEPLKFVDNKLFDKIVSDCKKFLKVYNESLDKNPNKNCDSNSKSESSSLIWGTVKQAKKYKKRILENMHKFPKEPSYNDKLVYQTQQMEIILNAYMRSIITECDRKGRMEKSSVLNIDTSLHYPSHPLPANVS